MHFCVHLALPCAPNQQLSVCISALLVHSSVPPNCCCQGIVARGFVSVNSLWTHCKAGLIHIYEPIGYVAKPHQGTFGPQGPHGPNTSSQIGA